MKSFLKKVVASALVISALALGVGTASPVFAADATDCSVVSAGISQGADCAKPTNAPTQLFGQNSIFVTVTNILLFIIGAIAVIMLIIGGIRYVVSGGDSTAVQGAKNTILYAIVGIVICLLAYAVVSFVIGSFTGSGTAAGGAGATNT